MNLKDATPGKFCAIEFRRGSVERFLRRRDFDFAMAVPSLHHRDEPVAGLEAVHRALKPGGRLWIYEGDPEAPLEELRRDRKPLRGRLRMPEWLARKGLRGHGFTVAEIDRTVRPAVAQTSFGTWEVARSARCCALRLPGPRLDRGAARP